MASLYIRPALTAARRLRLVLKLLPRRLRERAQPLQELCPGFCAPPFNWHAPSVALFCLSVAGWLEQQRAIGYLIRSADLWKKKKTHLATCLQPPAQKNNRKQSNTLVCWTFRMFGTGHSRNRSGISQSINKSVTTWLRVLLLLSWERCQRPLWHHAGPISYASYTRSEKWRMDFLSFPQSSLAG